MYFLFWVLTKKFWINIMRYMKNLVSITLVLMMIVFAIPVGGTESPCIDISTDAYGNLFVLNPQNGDVHKFDDNLNFLENTMSKTSYKMTDPDSFTVCWCAGELSFSSSTNGKTQMYEIDENWEYIYHRELAGVGSTEGMVKNPTDIKYLRSEEDYWVAITDGSLGKVVIIDDFGEFHREITGLKNPVSTYYAPNKTLFVIDGGVVKVFSPSGNFQRSFGENILKNPIAIDASKYEDKYYILDGSQIVVFDKDGNKINSFGNFKNATDISVNIYKNWVIVADCSGNGTLNAYDYDGNLIKTVESVLSPENKKILRFTVGSYVFYVNGEGQKLRCPVKIENDRSLVPVREIVENLDGKVSWDGDTKTILINIDNSIVLLKIDQSFAVVDGKIKTLPSSVPPRIYCNGVTMVPLRFVSEILGAEVEFNDKDKTIEVKK